MEARKQHDEKPEDDRRKAARRAEVDETSSTRWHEPKDDYPESPEAITEHDDPC